MTSSLLVLLLVAIGNGFGAVLDQNCQGTLPEDRIDCGYRGILQDECVKTRGCCWDANVAAGVPWCFKGKDKQLQCTAVDPKKRTDCGWFGISKRACLVDRNCCHDDRNHGFPTKHCFYPADHKCHGTPPKERKDCGYFGINRDECEKQKGCCWDDTVEPGLPYCYFGKDKQGDACKAVDPRARMDCGWPGINMTTCQNRKCCWDNTYHGFATKWCFYPADSKCYGIIPKDRVDCGYFGIQRDECEKDRACCFDDEVPDVPHCFKGKDKLS